MRWEAARIYVTDLHPCVLCSLSSIPTGEQRALQLAMEEVADWMALPGNEEEFVVLFFDDQMDLNDWVRDASPNCSA